MNLTNYLALSCHWQWLLAQQAASIDGNSIVFPIRLHYSKPCND